jgi:phosphoheptose isomerase
MMLAGQDKFPTRRYKLPEEYFSDYQKNIVQAWSTIDPRSVTAAAALLRACLDRDGVIYACGNGGSAAIANHLLCDFVKGIQTNTTAKPRVVSLSSHLELITAIANDIGYDDVFVYQLRTMARPRDVLLAISSSGDSENIVRAMSWAKKNKLASLAFVGFDGGRTAAKADVCIHVHAANYGIVEDVHQSMMHLLAQYLRQSMMQSGKIAECRF